MYIHIYTHLHILCPKSYYVRLHRHVIEYDSAIVLFNHHIDNILQSCQAEPLV